MVKDTNAAVSGTTPATAAELVEARKAAIRGTRDRLSANLNALEQSVRAAVGARGSSPGREQRAFNVVNAALTARRLSRLPFWRVTAITVVAAGLAAYGGWRARRRREPPMASRRAG